MTTTPHIRIGIIGSGFIARHFVLALDRQSELDPQSEFVASYALTRRPLEVCADFPRPDLLTQDLDRLLEASDVIFECSGDPLHAFDVASRAVEAGLPVVTMNAEFHVTCGSYFAGRGLVTEAEGDQPGCLASLHEDAVAMGFEPIVYGNMKGFLNHTPTPEEMAFWGEKQGLSQPMVTAFTDGTKLQVEQALVANGFGATIARPGLLGFEHDDLNEGAFALANEAEQLGQPISDYLLSGALSHGVFIVARHDDAQRAALAYYKLGDGPHYVLVRPNIFVHLEALKSIRRAMNESRGILDNSATPTISVTTIAKRDLPAGTRIENGIGSFDVRGEAVRIADAPGHLPIGLMQNAVLRRDIGAGEPLALDDVELPESGAYAAWREIERGALAAEAPGESAKPVELSS